jgi:hypothetical protein
MIYLKVLLCYSSRREREKKHEEASSEKIEIETKLSEISGSHGGVYEDVFWDVYRRGN